MSDPADTALWALGATEVAALVRARKISAREIAQAGLDRLDAVNPEINAVVECRPEETLAAADAIDAKIARGEDPGPLAGVPVTIKVIVDQRGYATTNGLRLQKDLIARSDNPVVANLLGAGAVSLGRTNTPAFSYRWFTNNQLHGHTYNPRRKDLTPGGSSGGAGSAVAAGIGAIAHGTDIAGSIRYPAYACGVHGLRPSFGRIAAHNASGAERDIGGQLMATSGPLARSVGDLRLALAAMAKPDPLDIWSVPAPLTGATVDRRAALCLRPDGAQSDPALERALLEAAGKLRAAGWVVDEIDALPPIAEAAKLQIALWLGHDHPGKLAAAKAEGDPGALRVLEGQAEFVQSLSADAIPRALIRRAEITREWALFMERYPLVLLPPGAELPFPDNLDLGSDADFRRVWDAQMSMVGLPVTGLPALALATGATADGAPLGIQMVAGRFREDVLFTAAAEIEARSPPVEIALL
ncbi:amidase [Thioclava sp. BHET1]|nr:amidase [Thioclava sp. BHET1]